MTVRLLAPLGPGWVSMPVQKIRDRVVNQCTCGRAYTFDQFCQLERVGSVNIGEMDGIEPAVTEQRLCKCGSTRAIWFTSTGDYCEEIGGVL